MKTLELKVEIKRVSTVSGLEERYLYEINKCSSVEDGYEKVLKYLENNEKIYWFYPAYKYVRNEIKQHKENKMKLDNFNVYSYDSNEFKCMMSIAIKKSF